MSQTRGVPRVGQAAPEEELEEGAPAEEARKRRRGRRRRVGTVGPLVFHSCSSFFLHLDTNTDDDVSSRRFARVPRATEGNPPKTVAVIHSGDTFTMSAALGLNVSAHLGTGRSPRAVRGVRRAASAPARRGRSVIRRATQPEEPAESDFALFNALVGGGDWQKVQESVRAAAVEGTFTPKVLGAAYPCTTSARIRARTPTSSRRSRTSSSSSPRPSSSSTPPPPCASSTW